MTDPLDLDAINEELAGAGCLRPRTAAKVLAEVERLRNLVYMLNPARMVLDRCAELMPGCREEAASMAQKIVDLIGHPVTDEPPHALVELVRLRADTVPRSALVQVGWWRESVKLFNRTWEINPAAPRYIGDAVPVYIIREDTDA